MLNNLRWSGFRVCEKRPIITPFGRGFNPKELESGVMSIASLSKSLGT
ncbi:DUF3653 domain-containing protein [Vibrio owensii]